MVGAGSIVTSDGIAAKALRHFLGSARGEQLAPIMGLARRGRAPSQLVHDRDKLRTDDNA